VSLGDPGAAASPRAAEGIVFDGTATDVIITAIDGLPAASPAPSALSRA
jgi:hypothetical protein